MKKIIKKYGNSAIVVLSPEDLKVYGLEIGKNLDFEITKFYKEIPGVDRIIMRDFETGFVQIISGKEKCEKIISKQKGKGLIQADLCSLHFQQTKDSAGVHLYIIENTSKEFLVKHLKSMLEFAEKNMQETI